MLLVVAVITTGFSLPGIHGPAHLPLRAAHRRVSALQACATASEDGALSEERQEYLHGPLVTDGATAFVPKVAATGNARACAPMAVAAEQDAVPAESRPARSRRPLPIRIDERWLDLRAWRAAHPAGVHWIDGYEGRDATDVMHAFHSEAATSMLRRLPRLSPSTPPPSLPPTSKLTLGFRNLRAKLIADGWYV